MKRVLMLVFNNFVNDSRVLKECLSLKNSGYHVTVIALHENHLKEHDEFEGIKIHRIKLKTRGLSKSLPSQIIKYLELAKVIIRNYKGKAEIIHCNDIMPLPIAVFMKSLSKKIKIVYDAHEFQTETQKLQGKKLRKRLTFLTEKFLIKKVDEVITVSSGIAIEYEKRYGIKEPHLIFNTPPLVEVQKTNNFRELFGIPENHKVLLYQGALATGRGIEKLVEAMKILNRKHSNVALVFMGMGHLTDYIKKSSEEIENIYYKEAVPPSAILSYTASADVGISLIEDSCLNYHYSLPNKLFEYAMAGLPVIVSDLPEMKRIVEEYNCGISVNSETAQGFIYGIEELLNKDLKKYRDNCKNLVSVYNWGNQEKKLLRIYENL